MARFEHASVQKSPCIFATIQSDQDGNRFGDPPGKSNKKRVGEARRGFEPLDKGFAGPLAAAVNRFVTRKFACQSQLLGQVWAKLRIRVRTQGISNWATSKNWSANVPFNPTSSQTVVANPNSRVHDRAVMIRDVSRCKSVTPNQNLLGSEGPSILIW